MTAQRFLKIPSRPQINATNQVKSGRSRRISESRLRLKPIVASALLLWRQNLPFRGQRDDVALQLDSPINERNFKELLKYRIGSGDYEFEKHFQVASAKVTYISNIMQNEIIRWCGEEISSCIIGRVRKAKMYSIIFDENINISRVSQISLILRQ